MQSTLSCILASVILLLIEEWGIEVPNAIKQNRSINETLMFSWIALVHALIMQFVNYMNSAASLKNLDTSTTSQLDPELPRNWSVCHKRAHCFSKLCLFHELQPHCGVHGFRGIHEIHVTMDSRESMESRKCMDSPDTLKSAEVMASMEFAEVMEATESIKFASMESYIHGFHGCCGFMASTDSTNIQLPSTLTDPARCVIWGAADCDNAYAVSDLQAVSMPGPKLIQPACSSGNV